MVFYLVVAGSMHRRATCRYGNKVYFPDHIRVIGNERFQSVEKNPYGMHLHRAWLPVGFPMVSVGSPADASPTSDQKKFLRRSGGSQILI